MSKAHTPPRRIIIALSIIILSLLFAELAAPHAFANSPSSDVDHISVLAYGKPLKMSVSDSPDNFPAMTGETIAGVSDVRLDVTLTGWSDTTQVKPGSVSSIPLTQTIDMQRASHYPSFSTYLHVDPALTVGNGERIGTVSVTPNTSLDITFNDNIGHYTGKVSWTIVLHGSAYSFTQTQAQMLADRTVMRIGSKYLQFANKPYAFTPEYNNARYLAPSANDNGKVQGWLTWNSFGILHEALTQPDDPSIQAQLNKPRILLTHLTPTDTSDDITKVSITSMGNQSYWAYNDTTFTGVNYDVARAPIQQAAIPLDAMRSIDAVSGVLPAGQWAVAQDSDRSVWVAINFGTIHNPPSNEQVVALNGYTKRDTTTAQLLTTLRERNLTYPQHMPTLQIWFDNIRKVNRVVAQTWNSWDSAAPTVTMATAQYGNNADGTKQSSIIYHSNYDTDRVAYDTHAVGYHGSISTELTRPGYAFSGWNTQPDGTGVTYQAGQAYMFGERTLSLYAIWQGNPSQITYNTNGGAPVPNTVGKVGDPAVIAGPPTRNGYTFTGWQDCKADISYRPDNEVTLPDGGLALCAEWNANRAELVYNANSGQGTMDSQQGVTDQRVTVSTNRFTRYGYRFVGWSLTADGKTAYQPGDTIALAPERTTLYAQWELLPATKHHLPDSGSTMMTVFGVVVTGLLLAGGILACNWKNGKHSVR